MRWSLIRLALVFEQGFLAGGGVSSAGDAQRSQMQNERRFQFEKPEVANAVP